ncbi:MAG: hypothetical protein WC342_07725 [Methanoregula sp.]|jgi:hypothetical protein
MIKKLFPVIAVTISLLIILAGSALLGFSLPIVILVLLFIFAVPSILYLGIKKIADPVPYYFPPVVGIAVIILLGYCMTGSGISENVTGFITAIFLLVSVAIIGPYPLFEKKIGARFPWHIFPLMSFLGIVIFFIPSMGESVPGSSLPLFGTASPLTGWIFDGFANLLSLQDVMYATNSPVYTIFWAGSFYLEVFVISFLYYFWLSLIPHEKS